MTNENIRHLTDTYQSLGNPQIDSQ